MPDPPITRTTRTYSYTQSHCTIIIKKALIDLFVFDSRKMKVKEKTVGDDDDICKIQTSLANSIFDLFHQVVTRRQREKWKLWNRCVPSIRHRKMWTDELKKKTKHWLCFVSIWILIYLRGRRGGERWLEIERKEIIKLIRYNKWIFLKIQVTLFHQIDLLSIELTVWDKKENV